MPPLPVIANCYRVTWLFSSNEGVTPRIVQHYSSPSSDVTHVGESIVEDAVANIFNCMPQNFQPSGIDVLPLDGTSITSFFELSDATQYCSGDNEFSPASAAIMKLKTDVRGPRGRGRNFIGPVAENSMENGNLEAADRGAMQTAWATTLTALAAETPAVFLVVASYEHADMNPVQEIQFETVLGTQRRRQQQLRST